MKSLQYLFLGGLATLLMAADCSNKDSEFYNDVFINSPNLITVEDNAPYSTGDNLVISANFPRAIQEVGQSTTIDLYKTTGATAFTFSYLLEKEVGAGQWSAIEIAQNNLVQNDGNTVAYGDFVLAQTVYDPVTETYRYRAGVQMVQPGAYRLRFTYNQEPSAAIVLTSDSSNGNIFATIFSSSADLDGGGYYYFTVN